MLGEDLFSEISFPSPIESTFGKVISIGWYDGTTSGVALASHHLSAFRFDLVDWGPMQDVRVFALSPLAVSDFEELESLYIRLETPKWPLRHPQWPSEIPEQKRMGLELEEILCRADHAKYVFASESVFTEMMAARRLAPTEQALLPTQFDDQPNGGFEFWQNYLGLSR